MRKNEIPQNFTLSYFIYQQTDELRCGKQKTERVFQLSKLRQSMRPVVQEEKKSRGIKM